MVGGDEVRIGDAERDVVIAGMQRAMAAGYLEFDELEERLDKVYAAKTRSQLVVVTSDLPEGLFGQSSVPAVSPSRVSSVPAVAPSPVGASQFSLLGDARVGGWISVGNSLRVTTLVGDSVVDLSTADIPADGVTVTIQALVGDVRVILPDGARAELSVTTVVGSRKEALTAPRTGGPLIRLDVTSVVGTVRVFSLSQVPEGKLRKLWNSMRSAT